MNDHTSPDRVDRSYERHADAVADLVVQGKSAQTALDDLAPTGGGTPGAIQRKVVQRYAIADGEQDARS